MPTSESAAVDRAVSTASRSWAPAALRARGGTAVDPPSLPTVDVRTGDKSQEPVAAPSGRRSFT